VIIPLLFSYSDLLRLWLGNDFSHEVKGVMAIMLAGVLLSGFGPIAMSHLRGRGFPRDVAIIQIIELPFYILAMNWLLTKHGVTGAAIAWSGRLLTHALLLVALSRIKGLVSIRGLGESHLLRFLTLISISIFASAGLRGLFSELPLYVCMIAVCGSFFAFSWLLVPEEDERNFLRLSLRKLFRRAERN
jgi:O-antigen/teichoic acid export membrane protein